MMNQKKLYIVIALLCFFELITLAGMTQMNISLQNEIQNVKTYYGNTINNMQMNIDALYANVDAKLEQQASFFDSVSCEYGAMNTGSCEAAVTVTVRPKAVSENARLFLAFDGKLIALEKGENGFAASVDVNVFESYEQPLLMIEDGGVTYTETADFSLSHLYVRYIPELNVMLAGSRASGANRITFRGTISCHSITKECETMASFVTIDLVVEKNGEVIEKLVLNEDDTIDFSRSYDVESGDTLSIRAVAEDTRGFVHETLIMEFFGGVKNIDVVQYIFEPMKIYDSLGNLVYEQEGYEM